MLLCSAAYYLVLYNNIMGVIDGVAIKISSKNVKTLLSFIDFCWSIHACVLLTDSPTGTLAAIFVHWTHS